MSLNRVKSPSKSAIIIGVTGQDGSYLSELLLSQGYSVMGVKRRSSTDTSGRLTEVMHNLNFHLVEGDITDYASMSGVFIQAETAFAGAPHEVYNLAAQSHVASSFNQPLATWDSTAKGVINILEIMRQSHYIGSTRFYQASTSEMFGDRWEWNHNTLDNSLDWEIRKTAPQMIQHEGVEFNPRSPYAIAKVAAHQAVNLYRDAYGLFGSCGILFNHESPRRGAEFVTRKISLYVARLYHELKMHQSVGNGLPPPAKLQLGNLDAKRDWGHARDYVRAMWLMLQQDEPDDFVVATGESHSVGEFCEAAFNRAGLDYKDWVEVNSDFIRPSEVPHLQGVATKAKETLGWEPQVTFCELVEDMVRSDIIMVGGPGTPLHELT